MKFTVQSRQVKGNRRTLTAVIDLGDARKLALPASVRKHPAAGDLQRRRYDAAASGGTLDGAYLAIGAQALLYLPAAAARFWDDDEKIRVLAGKAYDAATQRNASELVILLDGPDGAAAAPLAAEGIALRAYRFVKYRSGKAAELPELNVTIVVASAELAGTQASVERRLALAGSVNRARDLVNEPGSVVTPAIMEATARDIAAKGKMKISVLQMPDLAKQGYEGLITVGKGGAVPPRMIIINYEPKKAPQHASDGRPDVHLGLLGKGITFDTGGVSIKTAGGMWEMKGDMAGAAAVLYAMETIARVAPPVKVTAVVCTAQNYVDANAVVPGDIFRARNGKTIHVDNTDAEGRLVLSDGLWRMGEEKVTHIVDVATLTGACVRALGTALSGIMGNNEEFIERVREVGKFEGEPLWELPMVEEYTEWLKFEVADLNNIAGKPLAGATIAALFLREFVPDNTAWAHLDIAGTFIYESDTRYYRPGATGVMVRTLAALAESLVG